MDPHSLTTQLVMFSLESDGVSRLVTGEQALFRQPVQKGVWASICRFFRHLVNSKEECEYKDLRDTLRAVEDVFQKTKEVSCSVTDDQYRILRERFHGESRDALVMMTEKLEEEVGKKAHGRELQRLVRNIKLAIPQEIVPCPLEQKQLYKEIKMLRRELAAGTTATTLEELEKRLEKAKAEAQARPFFAADLEIASFLLEVRKIVLEGRVSELFEKTDTLLAEFEKRVNATTLLSAEKEEVIDAYKKGLKEVLSKHFDGILQDVQSRALEKIQNTSEEVALKAVWDDLNDLGEEIPNSCRLEGAINLFKEKSQALCRLLDGTPLISKMHVRVINAYQSLQDEIRKGSVPLEILVEQRSAIQTLLVITQHPLEVHTHLQKEQIGALTQILAMNQEIHTLLSETMQLIDNKLEQLQAPPKVGPQPINVTVPFGDGSVRKVTTPVADTRTTNVTWSAIQGMAISTACAAAGVMFGVSLPISSVVGMGLLAASPAIIDFELEKRNLLANKYVALISGMATMGLFAYFGPSLTASGISRQEVLAAVNNATEAAVNSTVPFVVEKTVNTTIPFVVEPVLNITVPSVVDSVVNATVSEVVPEVVNRTMNLVANATQERLAAVVGQGVREVVPEAVNTTLQTTVPTIVDKVTNQTVSGIVDKAVDNATAVFANQAFQRCGWSSTECQEFVMSTLSPGLKAMLTPELINGLTTNLTPELITQLREKLGSELTSELIEKLAPAINTEFVASFLPTLNTELLKRLPKELIDFLSERLTPELIKELTEKLTPELIKKLSTSLTEDLVQELKENLGPEVFKNLLPLIDKIQLAQRAEALNGAALVVMGVTAIGLAPIVAPAAAAAGLVGGAFAAAGGLAKVFGWV